MSGIISLIEPLIAAMFVKRTGKTEWALLILAVLCGGMGLFFLALGLYRYLENFYAAHIAALISSLLVFAVAALAMGLRKVLLSKRISSHKSVHDELTENIHVLVTGLFDELEVPIRENPKTSVALAALAGLLAARRI
jgi:hypothetical protein